MRLHAGPGRGGRGLPWLSKPKYMLHLHLHTKNKNESEQKRNFYEVLEEKKDNDMDTQSIKGTDGKKRLGKKHKIVYDQRKITRKIPDSKKIKVCLNENRIAPGDIEENIFAFTTVVRKKKKKKYNVMSLTQHYQVPIHILESTTVKSAKKIKCWKIMPMTSNNQDGGDGMEDMNTQDIEMEVANIENESIRHSLWNEIEKNSLELNLPIPEKREDSIETLEDALERLE